MNTRVKLTDEQKKENRRLTRKAHYEANKLRIRKEQKEKYEANKDKKKAYYEANKDSRKEYLKANSESIAVKHKERREAKKSNLFIVYSLPNYNKNGYDKYCGITNSPKARMSHHKFNNNNTQGWIILGEFETREEALIVEASYHAKGYAGKKGFDKQVA